MSRGWGPPPRRRPPWWPEGESFPPARGWGRGGPPPFVRRMGCFVISVLAVTALGGVAAGGLLARVGLLPVALLAAVFAILVVAVAVGGVRRMTRPVGNLLGAAGPLEAPDLLP